ncbi:hypothetical protein KI688_000725 [Linnemannia hyalina]|uniref:Uncharacterized protein n=1 Tax=Linnemannia hyalina TaxID=64524 RepID=A0A9P7Y6Z5_9FUNG|nr:hypothetical protein KI688_000725 [Linnemannia hyalina]
MTPHQRFRQGDTVVSIAIRIDMTTGESYSRITDIQKFFLNASLFNANGVFLNYLEDENEQVVTHYPNHTIDIVATDPLQQQLERSADQQSVYHQQQMHQLINMVAQQNEMVRQQNVMLQEQAASKEREERMLQEQAESKIREEQMLEMQQEVIDRLIVNQQRVDAILVQNYELHEYPIPRLFVVLSDSFNDWDPRTVLMERFRLFFLC